MSVLIIKVIYDISGILGTGKADWGYDRVGRDLKDLQGHPECIDTAFTISEPTVEGDWSG